MNPADSHRPQTRSATADDPAIDSMVADLVKRARQAQRIFERSDQDTVDLAVAAAGWAILEPTRNRELAERAVADSGIGNVPDKITKNHRKTLGLLRDLQGVRTVGVISDDAETGVIEIARPVGVVCAITPSTNPGATPANKIINALKCRNAVIVAPSPKGWSTCARLLEFIHAELRRLDLPVDLVQMLPAPVSKQSTGALMRACDLVVATGSQANVRAAYTCGTPAFGVGAGNVAAIVDESADLAATAARITRSKTFDNATSCSSENSVVVIASVRDAFLAAMREQGAVLLSDERKAALQKLMWPDGRLSAAATGKSADAIARLAADSDPAHAAEWQALAAAAPRILIVDESGIGDDHPYSGEKLSPVLALYTVPDFDTAADLVARIYAYQGSGHSVGLHSAHPDRALQLGLKLPVARVIVNQAHCIANGGSFDNGLPFSLSMGCGTWGRNIFSENLNYRQFLNITRIARPIKERMPSEESLLGGYFQRVGGR